MQIKFLFPLIGFILLAILLGVGLTLNPRYLSSTLVGKPVPAFSLPTLANQQNQFSPQQMLGQRWLLNVWASWCASCRLEHPLLNELANQLATKSGIPLIGLNYKDDTQKAINWLQQRGNPYQTVPLDTRGNAGIELGVTAVPETFVIDEQGTIIYKHNGPISAAILNNEILPLFDDKKFNKAFDKQPRN